MRFDTIQIKKYSGETIDTNYFFKCLEKIRHTKNSDTEKEMKYFIIDHLYITGLFSAHEIMSREIKIIRFKNEKTGQEYTVGVYTDNAYLNERGEIEADFYFGVEYKFIDRHNLTLRKIEKNSKIL